jgi:hypothetical protein
MSRTLVPLIIFTIALPAHSQTLTASPETMSQQTAARTPVHPRVDVALSLGGFRFTVREGNYKTVYCPGGDLQKCQLSDSPGPEPFTPAAQIGAGFYWNAHLKTEAAVAWTASAGRGFGGRRADTYDREVIYTADYTKEVSLLHVYDIRRTTVSQLFQFRPRKRWRPYVGVALGIDRETDSDSRLEFMSPARSESERLSLIQQGVLFDGAVATDRDLFATSFPPPVTTTHVHAFGRVGFKAGGRIFFLLEGQVGSRVVPLALGLGVDLF